MGLAVKIQGRIVSKINTGLREPLGNFKSSAFVAVPFCIVVFGVAIVAATAEIMPGLRAGEEFVLWRPYFHHLISGLVIALFFPIIIGLSEKYPLRTPFFSIAFIAHVVCALWFAAVHIGWTLAVYKLGDALQNKTTPVFLGNLHFEVIREVTMYGILSALIISIKSLRRSGQKKIEAGSLTPKILRLKDQGNVFCINVKDIEWIEAAKNYVVIHTSGKEIVHRTTLKQIEADLPTDAFVRASRSAIINVHNIAKVTVDGPRDQAAILRNGKSIRLSRSLSAKIIDRILAF